MQNPPIHLILVNLLLDVQVAAIARVPILALAVEVPEHRHAGPAARARLAKAGRAAVARHSGAGASQLLGAARPLRPFALLRPAEHTHVVVAKDF